MKLKYRIFRNHDVFIGAIRKIYTCSNYPDFKSTYRIKKICDTLETEMKTFHSMLQDLQKSKKEEGEKKEKLTELLESEFELKWSPLTKDEINRVEGLAPADIQIIEEISEPNAFSELEA